MWWLDPGKEVLNALFNRILAPYVENLDMNQVNYGIGQGQLTLRNLRMKKGALDKFRLPVDVSKGHLGKFTLSLHWMNLGNQPVEILIEDVYLLVIPSPQTGNDPVEEEQRIQAAKTERLENSELLHMNAETSSDSPQQQGIMASLISKVVNNLQVTVKNIHIRYEDKMSVPGHPFAIGFTLAGFTAESVNDNWQPAFIESTAGAIHKLAKLQSLGVYFDTDSQSMAEMAPADAIQKFTALISQGDDGNGHQFILKPVSGEGRIVINNKPSREVPHFDIQLLFEEIGVALDDSQYKDALSLVDMYRVYMRRHQYRKFRPNVESFTELSAKEKWSYAFKAILDGIHDRNRRWTWAYFAERRDDRKLYIDLFQRKLLATLSASDLQSFGELEKKLSYEDIRFYRSIARSRLRKDAALRKRLEEEKNKQQAKPAQSWSSWIWGSSSGNKPGNDSSFTGTMTEQQRKELYAVLDYDEKQAVADSLQAQEDALKGRVLAKLRKGSFTLRTDPHGKKTDVISVVFDVFQANVLQRADNMEASISLGDFGVFDGTTKNTVHPKIVQVQDPNAKSGGFEIQITDREPAQVVDEPFFFVKFENNPLDDRADTALTVKMRHMEIIYHRGYVEAVYKFFKPPESQLESVEALLSVASETLEGFRKETRAGLEYALQTHKTVDLKMDMNAPIIIIPEDITTMKCKHLIIDAGHISIDSNLADKEAVKQIHLKRNQKYSDEDYKRLESLMYDKMSLKLEAAQFLIGNDLEVLRKALASNTGDTLHLLERISIEFDVQNSIVPEALSIARFKVSGRLPSLQVNISDTKYQSLMRLVDVAIPNFDDGDIVKQTPAITGKPKVPKGFQLPSGLFLSPEKEYTVEDPGGNGGDEESEPEEFYETENGERLQPELHQHVFELNFDVEELRAKISKSMTTGAEKTLGEVSLGRFGLSFVMAKYDMQVDVNLGSVEMNLIQPGNDTIKFISSAEPEASESKDLLTVKYRQCQKASPEFESVYEGISQSVDIKISTFIFKAAPEPVLDMYDFIMTTFVPQSNDSVPQVDPNLQNLDSAIAVQPPSSGTIRVLTKLASVKVILVNNKSNLATLSLSTADVSVLLGSNTMVIAGRLGSLALSDDSASPVASPDFKKIMSIEGNDFADFRYQTFDPTEPGYNGVRSFVRLNAGSVKVHILEQPLHDIYLFVTKLAKLKGLYDAATQAAVQTASEIERMQFEVSIKTPIIVFPSNPESSMDMMIMRLGQIGARNSYKGNASKTGATLTGIQLISKLYYAEKASSLKMIDDIDIITDIVQTSGIDRRKDVSYPDTQVAVKVSDVRLHLTQIQYGLLIDLSQSIPRILAGAVEGDAQASPAASIKKPGTPEPVPEDAFVDLEPELRVVRTDANHLWTTVDLVLTINAVKLHLYDEYATSEANVKEHGISRFALNDNSLRFKMLSDGAGEVQVILRSFTISNTRPGNSKYKEIVPAAQNDRNQFMLLYTMSGGSGPALAILSVDSPQILFAVDPVFALLNFVTSPFSASRQAQAEMDYLDDVRQELTPQPSQTSSVNYRLDLHDVSITILENDTEVDSQAIKLSISQVLVSQQGIMALTVNRLGMGLTRMGKPSETVRFLDEVDMTVSMDTRSSSSQQLTSIEISSKPITFRASYRDINIITTIVNKAITLYGESQSEGTNPQPGSSSPQLIVENNLKPRVAGKQSAVQARVLLSKEQLKGSFDGFRLIIIGDLHEQPLVYLKVKPFIVGARDWTGQLQANTTIATQISYWNLTHSHWEPLIDPWTFTVSVAKEGPSGCIGVNMTSQEHLDINMSTAFMELGIASLKLWSREGDVVLQKARGSYPPYCIRNRTGSTILVWSDVDGSSNAANSTPVSIGNEETIDWRFDDWKTMREHISSSSQHNIGVQFESNQWERLRSIPVDREGEFTFSLRPRTQKYPNRLLCEVRVEGNTKVVTIRSTYKIENRTLYPVEFTLVDDAGHPVSSIEKIAPGQDYPLPIGSVMRNKIRLQPDQGFGYRWSSAIRWEDLVAKSGFTIRCPHADPEESAFRFQAWAQVGANELSSGKFPKINLKLRAPIELENLLPYNLQYRIYDKHTDQNWRSYLRKGGVMPVHSVELSHLVLLNIEVQDTVFKPSEFAIINTDGHAEFDVESRLTLRDAQDRNLDLRLNYVRYPDSGGAFKVQIYSPYIVVNKNGLPFSVKSLRSTRATAPQQAAGDTRPEILSSSSPYLLSHPHDKGHEFIFKIDDSNWSKAVSFEAPAAEIAIVVPSQRYKSAEIHAGLSWTEGSGKYKLTKVITLAPRFLIKNNLDSEISFREHGVAPREGSVIGPGQRRAFSIMRAGQERLLTISFPGLNAVWSPPINIEDIGSVYFRVRSAERAHLVCADVKLDGSTIFVFLNPADDHWPFIIENESKYSVVIQQTDLYREDPGHARTIGSYTVQPKSSIGYAWDFPAARGKKICLKINGSLRTIDVMEIGNLVPFKFADGTKTRAVSLDVRADGRKQILRITDYRADKSLYKPKYRQTGRTERQDTISSSEAFEAITEELVPTFVFSIEFAGIAISLVNNKMIEVIYLSINKLKFEYTNSNVAQSVNLSCGVLQIDNQLHDAIYPVILQPTPIPKETNSGALPTVQASIIWLNDQEHGVVFIKYCSILLQALTVEVDEDLLFSLYDISQIKGLSWGEGAADVLNTGGDTIPEPKETAAGQDLYFEVLELQPIKLSLSFMRTERVNSDERLSLHNPLAVVVNALTMTVGNVNDAPLEMNALAIKDMRLTMPELQSRITYHYRQDVLRQLYRVLGSADFIGNPVGLFTNVSSGVADIFYEPFNGVVMRGNKELGIGIAKGAASFVKKTVFGFSDSLTKFTSSVGKGLSAATFDSEYQAKRRITQRRNKPRHFVYGVTAGSEALASSFASAVEGVVMKPIEGAESGGAAGFFKGVGKGLVGAVTKPVVGVFDLASNVSEGIRNTTTVFDNPERDRARLPRHVAFDGVLRPFSAREALGQYWMKDLENGAFAKEFYVAHINIPGGDNVVLLTASRVLSFWSKKLRLQWELPFTQIQGVTVEDTGIRFAHKSGREADKFVVIPDKKSQSWFFGEVATVVKLFNARQRMDT